MPPPDIGQAGVLVLGQRRRRYFLGLSHGRARRQRIRRTGRAYRVRLPAASVMDSLDRITIEPGKRSGKPCIRGLRTMVYNILSYLGSGTSVEELLEGFPNLEREDVLAALQFAADRERTTWTVAA